MSGSGWRFTAFSANVYESRVISGSVERQQILCELSNTKQVQAEQCTEVDYMYTLYEVIDPLLLLYRRLWR